ncbi:MAG: sigma-70 family RNA polymerase sigma factor [Cellulophaga sp.]
MQFNKIETLWGLFLEGDTNAFSSLFKTFYPSLRSYGLKLSGNEAITEDCLHNLFIYLYDNRKKLGEVNNVKSYLFVSFRRALFLSLKKERIFIDYDSVNANTNFEFSSEELTIKQEFTTAKSDTVSYILNKLSVREREVIYLKYYSNLKTPEIASVMEISYQSVLNTLQKAFGKLRKTIEDDMLSKVLKK